MLRKFAQYEVDRRRGELRCDGTRVPIEPQVFDVIAFMAENANRLVTRQELIDAVWAGRIVSDAAIDSRIRSARVAIGDDTRSERWLKTVRGRGFLFDAPGGETGVVSLDQSDNPIPAEDFASAALPIVPPRLAAAVPSRMETPTDDERSLADGVADPVTKPDHRPSLAVLPFLKIGSPDLVVLGDALPHDMIAAFSRLRWLLVIARASSFQFSSGGDHVDVARQLNVRYLLTGAVDAFAGRITVTVELTDANRGGLVWAQGYRGSIDDVHELRSEIVASVVARLEVRIPIEEAKHASVRPPEALDAWGAYHLGLRHLFRMNSTENAKAAAMFARACKLDPQFSRAFAGLAFTEFQNAFNNYRGDFEADRDRAYRFAERAVELDPLDPFAAHVMGRTRWLAQDLGGASDWFKQSTFLNPNHAQSFYAGALVNMLNGEAGLINEGINTAVTLSPFDPIRYGMLMCKGYASLLAGDTQDAVFWAEQAARLPNANLPVIHLMAAVASELAGDREAALRHVGAMQANYGDYTAKHFFASMPFSEPGNRGMIAASLKRLGVD